MAKNKPRYGKTPAPVKAHIYQALAAVFGTAALIARTITPDRPLLVIWFGVLAIGFEYAAVSVKWKWQVERATS